MIRRKIWASATCCLALAGIAQAQSGTAPKAALGAPKADYTARGAAPNPGYPAYIPRNYVAPTPPGYSAPAASLSPSVAGAMPAPAELFAVGADPVVPPGTPAGPMPVTPMPMPTGPTPMAVDPGTVMPMPGSAMPGMPINGGPILSGEMGGAPFLEGMGGYNTDSALPTGWVSAEFLNWRLRGVDVPPLVTAAPVGSAGTLDDANTYVAYGNESLLRDFQTGVRLRAGCWFQGTSFGIDAAFFTVGRIRETERFGSNGDPGIFRPFFNTAIGAEDALLIAFRDPINGPLLAGTIAIDSDTDFFGGELNIRQGWGMGLGGRLDAIVGIKYLRLRDTIDFNANLTTLTAAGNAPAGTRIMSQDRFEAQNQFYGGQAGLVSEWQMGALTIGFRGTVALGITDQRINVSGGSGSTTPAGTQVTAPGGLLALPINIGEHSRTQFSIAPEVGVSLGFQVTNNIRVFGGYNFLYWTHVARAGEQIRRNINGTTIPDPTTGTANRIGAPAPVFKTHDGYFYSHGYSAGLEFRW
jgi:hypothetical protein